MLLARMELTTILAVGLESNSLGGKLDTESVFWSPLRLVRPSVPSISKLSAFGKLASYWASKGVNVLGSA